MGGGVTISSSQVMATFVTLLFSVPEPLLTEQVWPEGEVLIVTAQLLPLAIAAVKVTAPLVAPPSLKKLPSFESSQTTLPEAPDTVPLML